MKFCVLRRVLVHATLATSVVWVSAASFAYAFPFQTGGGVKCCVPSHKTSAPPSGCSTGCLPAVTCQGTGWAVAASSCPTGEGACVTSGKTKYMNVRKYSCSLRACGTDEVECYWRQTGSGIQKVTECSGSPCP